jgi:Iron-containing redox enzyme
MTSAFLAGVTDQERDGTARGQPQSVSKGWPGGSYVRQMFNTLLTLERCLEARTAALSLVNAELSLAKCMPRNELDGWSLASPSPRQWATEISRWRRWASSAIPHFPIVLSPRDWRALVRHHAPIAQVEGCWLQFMSGPATSHTAVSSEVLRSHAAYAGYGNKTLNVGNRYCDLMRSLGVALPELLTWEFATDVSIAEPGWRTGAFELAAAAYPVRFLPELLGYNLFRACYGLCPIIESGYFVLSAEGAATGYFDFYRSQDIQARLRDAALRAIEAFLALKSGDTSSADEPDQDLQRIKLGIETAKMLCENWLAFATTFVTGQTSSPFEQMMELVRSKAAYAFGYHRHSRLGAKSVDDYLNPSNVDPEALLRDLARSPYVRPNDSERSPLLSRLAAFGGPMFRVFSPDELQTIARWIDSLPVGAEVEANAMPAAHSAQRTKFRSSEPPRALEVAAKPAPAAIPPVSARGRPALREMYHQLLYIESFPEVLPHAAGFVEEWLVRSQAGMYVDDRRVPIASYSPEGLAAWLDDRHRVQASSYSTLRAGEMPSREEVIRQSTQLCPMVFIDGAWLQWAPAVAMSRTHLGSLLYQIYADELGNGEVRQNHPNVYRELMAQMAVPVPPFGTREFAYWDGFHDESFEVPTFWLAISRFPQRFMPELLGLNLAMELSGVGGSYRSAGDLLRRYGYSSAFVDLHNTIDNVSTGHTAMAFRAITLHMDQVAEHAGSGGLQRQWLRIWTGYRALQPPSGFAGQARLAWRRFLAIVSLGRVAHKLY